VLITKIIPYCKLIADQCIILLKVTMDFPQKSGHG
jgi:hypothetical protein